MRYLLIVLGIMIASCSAQTGPSEPATKEVPPIATEKSLEFNNTPDTQEMPSTPSNPPPVEKFVSLAKEDLAERLKIATDQITLVKTADMIWLNAALGCPSPGKVYAQGRVPGYQIRLEAGGMEYVYNTDLSGQLILCPQYDPDDLDSFPPTKQGPTPHIDPPIR
ncbi:MAG TPA: hypothetical protein VHP14_22665 [Anaerolineales bacterium]|nr:hypothetical protein [Anaerolineales bacterium]